MLKKMIKASKSFPATAGKLFVLAKRAINVLLAKTGSLGVG
jgi:hypothetical protein